MPILVYYLKSRMNPGTAKLKISVWLLQLGILLQDSVFILLHREVNVRKITWIAKTAWTITTILIKDFAIGAMTGKYFYFEMSFSCFNFC